MFSARLWFMLLSTAAAVIGSAPICAAAAETAPTRAERNYQQAQQRLRQSPTNLTLLVEFSRAAFEWAELAPKDDQRAEVAQRGMEAARRVIGQSSTNAAARYWLAMNMGQFARTKMFAALKLVREMEAEFLRARELDRMVDYAGPDRSVGLLYRHTPGWPTSIGSKKKARQHLERAVELVPAFPENHLCLLESYAEWDEKENFHRQFKKTAEALEAARAKYKGPEWEPSWADWEKRFANMKAKATKLGVPVQTKGSR